MPLKPMTVLITLKVNSHYDFSFAPLDNAIQCLHGFSRRLCCYFSPNYQVIANYGIMKPKKTLEVIASNKTWKLNGILLILSAQYESMCHICSWNSDQFFSMLNMNLLCVAFTTNSSLDTSPSPSVSIASLKEESHLMEGEEENTRLWYHQCRIRYL